MAANRLPELNFDSALIAANLPRVAPPAKKSLFSPRHDLFVKLLIEARKNAGLTQRQAAERLGRSQSFVAQSETGERRVDVLELVDLLKVYGLRPERFIQQIPPSDE